MLAPTISHKVQTLSNIHTDSIVQSNDDEFHILISNLIKTFNPFSFELRFVYLFCQASTSLCGEFFSIPILKHPIKYNYKYYFLRRFLADESKEHVYLLLNSILLKFFTNSLYLRLLSHNSHLMFNFSFTQFGISIISTSCPILHDLYAI